MRRNVVQSPYSRTVLLAAVLLAACAPALAAAPLHPLVGKPAPDFALRSSAGPNVRLSEYRGDVVVVTFWSSRCGLCGTQLAALDQLNSTYRSAGLVTLGVEVDDNQTAAREFLAARPLGFAMLLDPAKDVARSYRVDSLPMLLLIDRSGAVRSVYRDYKTGAEAQYLAQIKTLLDE